MYEIFPVMAGIVLALLIRFLDSSRSKLVALAAGSVAIGAVASLVSGELLVSSGAGGRDRNDDSRGCGR
jgi:hypothetical protein